MRHNKKRNVGIIYEQLSQAFSEALVERNQKKAMLVKKIIDDHYGKDGEIFREFKIFNALLKVQIDSDSLASKIIKEAKEATRNLSRKKLDIEKSLLIKDINYTLNEDQFYSRNVKEYKNLATIQTLMNMWNNPSKDNFQKLVEYENKIHTILREEKINKPIASEANEEVDYLVVKLMQEKFNKKYKPILSEEQSKIIETYVCSDKEETIKLLAEVKRSAIEKIKDFNLTCTNKILLEKSTKVSQNILDLNESIVDDDNIAKFLVVCKLRDQLGGEHE